MNAIRGRAKNPPSVNSHPLISKYFKVLGADGMIPAATAVRLRDFTRPAPAGRRRQVHERCAFYLDRRMTLSAHRRLRRTEFKGLLGEHLRHPHN